MVSPIIVLLRWPTCISFAMLGDEKSTATRRGVSIDGLGAALLVNNRLSIRLQTHCSGIHFNVDEAGTSDVHRFDESGRLFRNVVDSGDDLGGNLSGILRRALGTFYGANTRIAQLA